MTSNKDSKTKNQDDMQTSKNTSNELDRRISQAIKNHNKKFPYNKVREKKIDNNAVITTKTHDAKEKDKLRSATRMAAELIASPLVGAFFGYLFDQKFTATKPLGLAIGFIFGVIAAFYSLYKISKKM